MPTKIFVGNLSANTRSEDIRELFEKYGKVTECDVLKNFGFVHMQDETEANAAILELDGYSVKGTRMRVEKSTGKSKGGGDRRGSRGRGGGSRGGSGGGGRGGDRYSSSRYDPYARPPSYDYYDRGRYPPPPRDDRRYPPPGEDRYARDRYDYRYERRPPPADDYAYERRPPPPDSYYRDRVDRSGLSRPPPDYYARR